MVHKQMDIRRCHMRTRRLVVAPIAATAVLGKLAQQATASAAEQVPLPLTCWHCLSSIDQQQKQQQE